MTVSTLFIRSLCEVARIIDATDTRHYLHGVFVESYDGYAIMVATDGHRLLARRIEDESIKPIPSFIMPAHVLKQWKFKPSDDDRKVGIISRSKGEFHVIDGDVTRSFKGVDGTYPDWRRVIPSSVNETWGQFNWEYMHDFAKIGKALGIGAPRLVMNGEGPALIKFKDDDTIGVLMPMRADKPNAIAPDWINHKPAIKAAA